MTVQEYNIALGYLEDRLKQSLKMWMDREITDVKLYVYIKSVIDEMEEIREKKEWVH